MSRMRNVISSKLSRCQCWADLSSSIFRCTFYVNHKLDFYLFLEDLFCIMIYCRKFCPCSFLSLYYWFHLTTSIYVPFISSSAILLTTWCLHPLDMYRLLRYPSLSFIQGFFYSLKLFYFSRCIQHELFQVKLHNIIFLRLFFHLGQFFVKYSTQWCFLATPFKYLPVIVLTCFIIGRDVATNKMDGLPVCSVGGW